MENSAPISELEQLKNTLARLTEMHLRLEFMMDQVAQLLLTKTL